MWSSTRCPTCARWRRTATQRLRELAGRGPLKIAACYPRAVKWLFAAAGAQLADPAVRIWNMRVEPADAVIGGLLEPAGSCRRRDTTESRRGQRRDANRERPAASLRPSSSPCASCASGAGRDESMPIAPR